MKLFYGGSYMQTGVIKWYDSQKGYGFISGSNGEDVFVHHSQIKEKGNEKDLNEGEEVQFDIVKSEKGFQAINVQKI